jgi:hypothetical protein
MERGSQRDFSNTIPIAGDTRWRTSSTMAKIQSIRQLHAAGWSQRRIARELGLGSNNGDRSRCFARSRRALRDLHKTPRCSLADVRPSRRCAAGSHRTVLSPRPLCAIPVPFAALVAHSGATCYNALCKVCLELARVSRAIPSRGWASSHRGSSFACGERSMDNSTCVILVPANTGIEPECDFALRQLESMGYPVWRVPGFAAIDTARSQIATDAVDQGFEELMWIDSDMEFDPASVMQLRTHNLPIVCGLYPKKGRRALSSAIFPRTESVIFGRGGGLLEIRYAATGFLYTRRRVYLDIQRHCELPICNLQFNHPLVPFFMTMTVETDESTPANPRHWYLSEDFAFSHRARLAGYKIFADTSIRVGHIGRYTYAWEDAGISMNRYETFHFTVNDAKPAPGDK